MNILILSDIEAGGEWIATQTLIEKLRNKDKSFKFYLVSLSKDKYLLKKSLFEGIFFIKKRRYNKPFKYYRELINQLISGKRVLDKIFENQKFDQIITTDYFLAISYLISQKRFNYIYYFHGIRNNFKIFPNIFNHYMAVNKILEVLAWKISKKFITPLVFPNLVRKEFATKYSLSDINRFRLRFGVQNKKIILYSGRLVSGKGIENLINAFLLLEKKFPELVLVIVYLGKPKIELYKHPNIVFVNNPSVRQLSILYQASTLAVLPSPFEISSLFVREALTCSLPIITTNTGDSSKILSNKFIIKKNDSNSIYIKITDFLRNQKKYKQDAKIVSERWKKQYNEEKIIINCMKIIKNL